LLVPLWTTSSPRLTISVLITNSALGTGFADVLIRSPERISIVVIVLVLFLDEVI
jgi:hypothetical protein